jgi:hypothetical protein
VKLRLTNRTGIPRDTHIIDYVSGIELPDAVACYIYPFDVKTEQITADVTLRGVVIDITVDGVVYGECPSCGSKYKYRESEETRPTKRDWGQTKSSDGAPRAGSISNGYVRTGKIKIGDIEMDATIEFEGEEYLDVSKLDGKLAGGG